MIARRTTRRRGGFTLIELLVVVALIATLAALAAGTFFRIQAAEYFRSTEATLRKAHSHLDIRHKAVLDDAGRTVPAEVMLLADNDKDRAIALWTHAKLQSEFPESFAEVWNAGAPRNIVLNGYVLPPKKIFTDIASKTYTPAPTTDEQAAALFYAAINATSVGGLSPQSDGLNNQTVTTPSGLTMYKDAWGTPITFRRWAKATEMQSAPLLTPNKIRWSLASAQTGTFVVNNPYDPMGRLFTRTAYPAENPWADPSSPSYKKPLCLVPPGGTNPNGINLPDFTNENYMPTLISFGPGKKAGMILGGDDDGNDNIHSFRLRREGNRGD